MPISSKNIDAYARQLASQGASFVSPTGSGLMTSSGTIIKPTITYNAGGTVTIGSSGTYRFFHTVNYFGEVSEHTIAETTLSIPDQITSYIVASYNSGTPQYSVTTDLSTINFSNNVAVYTCSRVGDTNVDILDWDEPGLSLANKILRRDMETRRFERVSGLNLGEEIGRKIVISAGVVWQGSFRNSRIQVDSVANYCEQVNTDVNGNWIRNQVTTYNNSQYNTGTGLATLTDGNYTVNWIYRSMGINAENIIILLGTGDYDLNQAKTAQPPNNAPSTLSTNAMLIGKIIVLKDAETAIQIDSVFQNLFAPSATSSHEGLTSLQGGDAIHHYHSDQEINKGDDVEFNSVTSQDDLTFDALIGKNIIIKKSILPDLNNTHNIGSSTKVIKEVFTETITSDVDLTLKSASSNDIIFKNGNIDAGIITSTGDFGIGNINPTKKLEVTGDVFIDGELTVDGTITQVNVTNLDVTNKNINLAVSDTPTDALANDGGIILKGTTDKTILWDNSNVEWDISDGLDVNGIIKANGTTNDGSTNIFVGKDSLAIDVFKVDTNGKVTASAIVPITDSTTAFKITKADGTTTVLNIDTTNERVEVKGTAAYGIQQIVGDGTNVESSIGFKDTSDTNTSTWVIGKNIGNTTDRFGIYYNDGEKVVITSDGKFGVGTNIPVGKLQINRNSLYSDTEYSQHGVIITSGDAFDANIELYMGADNTNKVGYIQTTGDGSLKPLILQGRGGSIGIGTTDLDGTPSVGVLTVKGTSNDGSTDIFIGRDSSEVNVFKVDTDGKITTSTIAPISDSTTAVRITKADKTTSVLNVNTTNGRIGINTDTPTNALQIVNGGIRIDSDMTFYLGTHATNHGEIWYELTNTNLVLRNGTSGGVYLNDPGATSWTAVSDRRLKDNIISLDSSALDKVLNLNPVTYYWNSGDDTSQQAGFIAQEVDALGLDTVVSKPKSDEDFYGLKYEKLIPYLAKAIIELNKKIEQLKNQI